MKITKSLFIVLLLTGATSVILSQGVGTPNTLRVRTDANGYLMASGAAQTAPYVTTTFNNARLRTDSSGNLLVASAGGIAPADATYITQTTNSTLSAEQAIASLSSGILRGATTTGVITSLGDVLPIANGGSGAATWSPYTFLTNATGSTAAPSVTNGPIYLANGVASGNIYKASGRLYWENTNSVTTAMSVVPAFGSAFSLKGGTLGTNGDRLYLRVSVTLGTAATDNKNLNCNIGYTNFNTSTGAFTGGLSVIAQSSTANAGALSWYVEGIVTRTGATATAYEWQSKWGNTTTTQGANYTTDASTITWANDNNFLCAVYNTTASNTETLRLNMYSVDWQPYHP